MGCVAAGVLFFLSFRYDWYGYDRFIPEEGKIASAGLELSIDENFLNWYAHAVEEDGKWVVKHTSNIDFVQNHMQLTDMGYSTYYSRSRRNPGCPTENSF